MLTKFLPKTNLHQFIASIGSLLLALISTFLFSKSIGNSKQDYHDIIAGNIVWSDQFKDLDYGIVYFFIGIFVVFLILLTPLVNKIKLESLSLSNNINTELFVCIFLLIYSVTLQFFSGNDSFLYITILSFLTYLIVNSGLNKKRDDNSFEKLLLSTVFVYFSAVALFSLINFIMPNSLINEKQWLPEAIALTMWIIEIIIYLYRSERFNTVITIIMKITQITHPLILLSVVFGNFQINEGFRLLRYDKNILIIGFMVVLLISWTIIKNIIQKEYVNIWEVVHTPTYISLSVLILLQIPVYSGYVSDDFHLGELFMPLQQMINYNLSLNTDIMSVQGIMGPMYSMLNIILYDGKMATINYTFVIFPILFGIIVTLISRYFYGTKIAFLFMIFCLPILFESGMNRTFLIVPILMILFHQSFLGKPLKWIISYIWISGFHCMYNPSMGAALTLALLPVACIMIYKLLKLKLLKGIISNHRIIFSIGLLFHVVIIYLLFPVFIGTINFILDNGSANTLAYGISLFSDSQVSPDWFPKPFPYAKLNRLFWESIRIGGWVLSTILFILLSIRNIKESKFRKQKPFELLYYVVSIIFLLLITRYSLGRLDPASMHRSGSITLICFTFLIPSLFVIFFRDKMQTSRNYLILFLAILLGAAGPFGQVQFTRLTEKITQPIVVPADTIYISGKNEGIPGMGNGFIATQRWEEMRDFNIVLSKMLKSGETYGDLTNRTLFYVIFNKKVPTIYSSDYVAANEEIQAKMIEGLEKDNPPLVFIGPSIRHDGGPASIRSYRVYKWLMERDYVYYEYNTLQFLVKKDRLEEIAIHDLGTAENENKLTQVFHLKDLNSLPVAWGRGLDLMEHRFESASNGLEISNTYQISISTDGIIETLGKDAYLTFKVDEKFKGYNADFLLIDLEILGDKDPFEGQLFWRNNNTSYNEDLSFLFNVTSGRLLIPLGSNPNWIKNSHTEIRFDIGDKPDIKLKINDIRLIKLIN